MVRVQIVHADQMVYLAAEVLASRADADMRFTGARLRAEGVAREVRRLSTRLRMIADPRLQTLPDPNRPRSADVALVRFSQENERDYLGSERLVEDVDKRIPLRRLLAGGAPVARDTIVLATTLMSSADDFVQQLISADAIIPLLAAGDVVVHGHVEWQTVQQLVRALAGDRMEHGRQIGELLGRIARKYGDQLVPLLVEHTGRDFLAAVGRWCPAPAVAALLEFASWGFDGDRQTVLAALATIGVHQPDHAIRGIITVGRGGSEYIKGLAVIALAAMPLPADSRDVLGTRSLVRAELVDFLRDVLPNLRFPPDARDVVTYLMPLAVMCAIGRLGEIAPDATVDLLASELAPACAKELSRQNRAPIAVAALDALVAALERRSEATLAATAVVDLIDEDKRRQLAWERLLGRSRENHSTEELPPPDRVPPWPETGRPSRTPWLYGVIWERLLACFRDEFHLTSLVVSDEMLATPATPTPQPQAYQRRPLPDHIRTVRLDELALLAGSDDPGQQRDALDVAEALAGEYPLEALPILADYAAVDDRYGGGSFRKALDILIRDYPDEARWVLTNGVELPGGGGWWRPQDHPSREVRVKVAKAAQDLGETYPRDMLAVLRRLQRDPDDYVRTWAVRSQEAIRKLHGETLG